jgi:hypothetical protein
VANAFIFFWGRISVKRRKKKKNPAKQAKKIKKIKKREMNQCRTVADAPRYQEFLVFTRTRRTEDQEKSNAPRSVPKN